MNKIQNIINELHAEVDKLGNPKMCEWMHEKIDELDAYLTWTEVKARSGQIPTLDMPGTANIIKTLMAPPEKETVMAQPLTDDEWFKLVEKHHRSYLVFHRDVDDNFLAEVREPDKGLVIYQAPDMRTMSQATLSAFMETMSDLI